MALYQLQETNMVLLDRVKCVTYSPLSSSMSAQNDSSFSTTASLARTAVQAPCGSIELQATSRSFTSRRSTIKNISHPRPGQSAESRTTGFGDTVRCTQKFTVQSLRRGAIPISQQYIYHKLPRLLRPLMDYDLCRRAPSHLEHSSSFSGRVNVQHLGHFSSDAGRTRIPSSSDEPVRSAYCQSDDFV